MRELGRRAVACKGWMWMPGMRDTDGARLVAQRGACSWYVLVTPPPDDGSTWLPDSWWPTLPDFEDAATCGCLLEIVREAFDDPTISAWCSAPGSWEAGGAKVTEWPLGDSEVEALLMLLESAT